MRKNRMKKVVSVVIVSLFTGLSISVSGCSNLQGDNLQENKNSRAYVGESDNAEDDAINTLQVGSKYKIVTPMMELKDAVVEILGENYWPDALLTEEEMAERTGISSYMYDNFMAEYQHSEAGIDMMIIIETKEEYIEDVEKYLNDLINKGGFIVGCYVNDTLVASAFCEQPSGDYLNNLYEIGLCEDEINDTYVSGYVMVDPLYRGNSLHKILLETRIEESINRGKKNILTAVAVDNIFSLKTILNLGFEVRLQKENEYGIKRNILFKQLTLVQEKIECTA